MLILVIVVSTPPFTSPCPAPHLFGIFDGALLIITFVVLFRAEREEGLFLLLTLSPDRRARPIETERTTFGRLQRVALLVQPRSTLDRGHF